MDAAAPEPPSGGDTREKLDDAKLHLENLEEAIPDRKRSNAHLCAFLTAARSVLDYLSKEYAKVPLFRLWLEPRIERLRADPDVGFVFEQRRIAVHERYPDTRTQATAIYSVGVTLVDGVHIERVRRGEVVETREYDPKEPTESRPGSATSVTHHWFFVDNPEQDLVSLGRVCLDRLGEVVEEAERYAAEQFLSQLKDPPDPYEAFRLMFP